VFIELSNLPSLGRLWMPTLIVVEGGTPFPLVVIFALPPPEKRTGAHFRKDLSPLEK